MTFGFQAEGMICLLSPFLPPPVCYLHTIVSGHYQICDLLSASSTVLSPRMEFYRQTKCVRVKMCNKYLNAMAAFSILP